MELHEFKYVHTEYVAGHRLLRLADKETKLYILSDVADTVYDNSKPFSEFLKKQGINDILKKTDLTLRRQHSIISPVRTPATLEYPQISYLRIYRDCGFPWKQSPMPCLNSLTMTAGIIMSVVSFDMYCNLGCTDNSRNRRSWLLILGQNVSLSFHVDDFCLLYMPVNFELNPMLSTRLSA